MKQTGIKLSSFCFALAILLCSFVTAYAEDSSGVDTTGADTKAEDSTSDDNSDVDSSKTLEINDDA